MTDFYVDKVKIRTTDNPSFKATELLALYNYVNVVQQLVKHYFISFITNEFSVVSDVSICTSLACRIPPEMSFHFVHHNGH